MFELERKYPIDLGPIFSPTGWYVGQAFGSISSPNQVLIKSFNLQNMVECNNVALDRRGINFKHL